MSIPPSVPGNPTPKENINLYFCEKCGKRVSELDIEAGRARNKQLRGVFCSSCAVGVNTMTFDALTDVSTWKAVEESRSGKPPTAAHKTPVQKHVEVRVPRPVAASKENSGGLFIALGVVAVVIVGVIALGSGRNSTQPDESPKRIAENRPQPAPVAAPRETVRPAEPAPPVSKPAVTEKPASPVIEKPSPNTAPPPIDSEAIAADAFDKLKRFEGIEDKEARIAATEAFLKDHGESVTAARARTLLAELKKEAEAARPAAVATDAPPKTPEKPEPAKPATVAEKDPAGKEPAAKEPAKSKEPAQVAAVKPVTPPKPAVVKPRAFNGIPFAEALIEDTMGYTIAELKAGAHSHNNMPEAFGKIPPELDGLQYTQMVSGKPGTVRITFKTPGVVFIIMQNNHSSSRAEAAKLKKIGQKVNVPEINNGGQIYETWAVVRQAGEHVDIIHHIVASTVLKKE